MRIKKEIDYLIIWKKLHGLASHEELASFQAWLQSSSKNKEYFSKLQRNYDNDSIKITQQDIEQSWQQIDPSVQKRRRSVYKKWLQVAAAVMLPLGLALSVLHFSGRDWHTVETAHQIVPGHPMAVLKLANGEFIELDANDELTIMNDKGIVIGVDSMDVLTYDASSNETAFNTISVPRGGEYQLVLSDGTKVWLNSESSLTYPISFSNHQREVFLTGEAYFDVTTDKEKPFVVKTTTSDVKVYGTQFNVMSYDSDKLVETTLVEGSVAVIIDGMETLIHPGQQAQINKVNNQVFINEVNVELYTAWKDGIFRFEEMSLQQMADKLGRWYDVDFFFANEDVKNKRFTGAVKRETDFGFFINLIEETTKVKVEVNNKAVLVKTLY
ncbi:FecR family protein [Carboxylicivirga mesophila]|uniref:FecR family protein n=1 Tax=Carboxylicivirga mesophila TaxID=1166478 RepID=A0ABS5KCC9_9BACT|nr:FecR domain-containing protein [Carboxylicivirga mesophila]MBS2212646.1 FecR family protein [Carboxylicivirga mesophila]